MRVIKNSQIIDDEWILVGDEESLPAGAVIVSLERFHQNRDQLLERTAGNLGVLINGDHDLDPWLPDLKHLALIALEFPTFADGRGYSMARILRERHGFSGELRAVGDVLRDQLQYMSRCGIDTFCLREDQDGEAVRGLTDLSVFYQPPPI